MALLITGGFQSPITNALEILENEGNHNLTQTEIDLGENSLKTINRSKKFSY